MQADSAPSVLLEVLRTPRADYRDRDVAAMVASGGLRLPSEIELCCNDFVHTVRRHRPRWQRTRTDYATVNHFHTFWTQGIWDLAVADPDAAHQRAGSILLPHQPKMVANQRANRNEILDHQRTIDYIDLKFRWTNAPGPFGIAFGESIEAWRIDIGLLYWNQLARRAVAGADTTWMDWFGSYLDLERVTADSTDFGALWLHDLSPADVQREWLQSALRWTQTQMRITDSNPVDEQHSAYLPNADLFLSTDRRLVSALRTVRNQAPFPVAEPRLIDRDTRGPFLDEIVGAGLT